MHARHEYGDIVWVDLESPNALEIRQIATEFDLAENVAEELISPTTKARSEFYPDYLYIVLQFPALKHSHKTAQQEVDFVIGRDYLITVRYDTIDPLHKFEKVFGAQAMLNLHQAVDHAGFLFYQMLRKIYRGLDHELDYVRRELSLIEEHIFSGREVDMVAAISHAARGLLNLRQTIEPHRDVLHALEEHGPVFFGDEFSRYLRELSSEYYRVHNHIARATDSLHELRETNNSLLSTKQNETMKVLTVIALFMLPLSFIAEVFAMDTKNMPIIGLPHDFWIIVGLMVALGAAMLAFFKHKKWL